jgi:acetyl esterase/lipase
MRGYGRGVDPSEVLRRPAPGPDIVLRYAGHADGLVDVFLPPSPGRPERPCDVLVLIHGGFWRKEYDRRHLRPLADALRRNDLVVAIPEFRRAGGAGGWPMTGDDVRQALRTLPALIEAVAPGRTDPDAPVILMGHSAGGHLALWAGLHAGSTHVRRIVALAPITDLPHAARAGLDDNATQLFLGGGPDEVPSAYDDADPFGGLAAHSLADSTHPAITVLHGTDDRHVPVEMSRAAATRHPRITYVELEGVEHFALIDPLTTTFTTHVLPAVLASSLHDGAN